MFHINHYTERIKAIQRISAKRGVVSAESKEFLCQLVGTAEPLTDQELLHRLNDVLQLARITQRLTS